MGKRRFFWYFVGEDIEYFMNFVTWRDPSPFDSAQGHETYRMAGSG